jgi:hypothetical protein
MVTLKKMNSLLSMVSLLLGFILTFAALAGAVEVGDQAPDFLLPSTMGDKISLSQFKGKKNVLLEFYVADFGGT